jgi:hypothetical protein
VRALVADDPLIAALNDCMLRARAALWQEYLRLHKAAVALARRDGCAGASCALPASGQSARWRSRHRSTIRAGCAIRRRSEPISG